MKKLLVPVLIVLLAVGAIVFTACEGVSGTDEDDLLADTLTGYVYCDEGYLVNEATVTLYYSDDEGSTWYLYDSDLTDVTGYYVLDPDWRDHYEDDCWYKIVATKGNCSGMIGGCKMGKYYPPNTNIILDGCPHPYPHGGP
ncbi:MAG: hypothetical protein GF403_03290 [Candidatus Coatesbacteria bacterium]|nr:hypothetical protein [Candidatus Coatesbacteria bacterium]